MNHSTAYAELATGGFIGRFRLDWRTEHFKVRTHRGGSVLYFSTAAEAECAAWRVKHKIEERRMVRDGAKIEATSAADALFNLPGSRKVVRQSKTKRLVEVVKG